MILSALLGVFLIAVIFGLLAWRKATNFLHDGSIHSRPMHHAMFSAVCVIITGVFVLVIAAIIGGYSIDRVFNNTFDAYLLQNAASDSGAITQLEQDLILRDAQAFANGTVQSTVDPLRQQLGVVLVRLEKLRFSVGLGVVFLASLIAGLLSYRKLKRDFRARVYTETSIRLGLCCTAAVAIFTTLGIILSLIGETADFFSTIPIRDFLFGKTWSPLSGVFDGQLAADKVGALPLFAGTLLITMIAMLVAIPCGLFAAIYLSDFASQRVRSFVKPVLEVLAGIPTVVYGFFAAITVAPLIRDVGEFLGLDVDAQSALAAGIVMGIMIIPFISSLSDDVINAVPQTLRDGALALGATGGETIWKVVLPAALPGIVSAVLLGISRAVGETMIVVMAAGQSANLSWNPLESVTTVTVQIVALITGDTEADTAAGPAFALGFVLFCMTLLFNIAALLIVRRYRERYE